MKSSRTLLALCLLALGAAACARILGIREPGPRPFEHRAHVVAGISCLTCHAGVDEEDGTGPLHLPGTDTCLTCHQEPHETRPCGGCHGHPLTAASAMQAREHLRFSHVGHGEVTRGNCMRCHAGVGEGDDRMRPGLADCTSCHEHRDRFEVKDCNACHTNLARELRPPPSHMVHGDEFLAGHGAAASSAGELCKSCHREQFCGACHGAAVPALPARLTFDQPFAAGMHRAGFSTRHAEASRAEPGLCSICHTEESCRRCHDRRGVSAPMGESRRNPHPAGWVGPPPAPNDHGRAARVDPLSCASCHGGAGEALCVECHRVGGIGGSVHPPGWSSPRSLLDMPCRLCHVGGQ